MNDEGRPPKLANETQRLQALKEYGVLDTPPESVLDDITYLASQICGTPIALISLVDENRQWFKSHRGVDVTETPREIAFCAHAIREQKVFVVEDATKDPRFAQNPLVTGATKVQFYAGAPLMNSKGFNLGTLCVIDHTPKSLTPAQLESLQALARQVVSNFERRKLEQEKSETQALIQHVLEATPSLISYIDQNYIYRYTNTAYLNWFQFDPSFALGKTISEVLGADVFNKAKSFMDLALAGVRQEFDTVLPYKVNGVLTPRHVQVNYVPRISEEGSVQGIFAIVNDVSSLKKAELKAIENGQKLEAALNDLSIQEKLFRTVVEYAPIGIIQIDTQFNFVAVNPAFSNFVGYSSEELRQMTILDLTHPEDLKVTKDKVDEGLRVGMVNRFEKRYIHKNGKVVWGLITSKPVRLEVDGKVFLFSVIEDVTEVKKQHEALMISQAQMIESSKMASLGEMAGGVAHEINNPLAIIQAKAGQIKSRVLSSQIDVPKIIGDLERIEATVQRIAKIIKGLRTFSRNSDNDPMEIVFVYQVLHDSLELCAERLKHKGIQLIVNCPEDLKIECRPAQISQILLNLLNNSFDAVVEETENRLLRQAAQSPSDASEHPHSKWVQVDVHCVNELIEISVMDCGLGIPPQIVEKMMHPFFTTKEIGKGTGLGLSISVGIASDHNGKLYYDSKSPNTRFVLQLPVPKLKSFSDAA